VLTAFLFAVIANGERRDEDNTLVGAAEAAYGISELLFALPIGYVADKWSMAGTVRVGGVLMLAAIAVTMWAVDVGSRDTTDVDASRRSYDALVAAMVAWGVTGGVMNGPTQSLFAASLPRGKRTEGFSYLYAAYLVASCAGPLVTLVMFSKLSTKYKDWTTEEIRPVFLVGLSLEIVVAIMMAFFRDVPAGAEEDEEEEEEEEREGAGAPAPREAAEQAGNGLRAPLLASSPAPPDAPFSWPTKRGIPFFLFFSSLVQALGSGASVKFFPLFFESTGLSISAVQVVYAINPLAIALFIGAAKGLADRYGRVQTMIFFETVGSVCLLVMSLLAHLGAPSIVLIPVFVFRTAAINAPYPLSEAVLMDYVPAGERARWKSLESVAALGWTGSAMVGGLLADSRGYAFAFTITAAVQLCAAWIKYPLVRVVPVESVAGEGEEEGVGEEGVGEEGVGEGGGAEGGAEGAAADADARGGDRAG